MYMYVWAGDVQRKQPDRLVVLNYDQYSPDYGKVIGFTDIPGTGGIDNEPHHCGISANLKVIACGGLLSVLRNQNGIFFFDISNPAKPRFMFSTRAAQSSVTDAFVALPDNGFLITQMGSASGGTPGRVVEVNGQDQIVHEWPNHPPTDGFNPHGISIRQDLNLMITNDFVDMALSLLNDLQMNAVSAFSGQIDQMTGTRQEGAQWVFQEAQRLAEMEVTLA